jgi:type I restriction enzyme S subunit
MKPGYKQTEVGVIPEDWEVKPLGDVIKLQGGYSFRSENFSDIGTPVIRISDIQGGVVNVDNAICHPTFKINEDFVVKNGDLLVAMSGATTGKVGVFRSQKPAYQNQRVGRFVVRDENRTSPGFIGQLVGSVQFGSQLRALLEQGAQPNISGKQIESLAFPMPNDLPEQRAIAEALSDVDGLLGGLDRLIAKKRDLKQAAMQQLLTGQTRLPGFHGEWEVKTLFDLAGRKKELFDDGDWIESEHIKTEGIRLIQTGNIGVGSFIEKGDKKYINEASFSSLRCKQLMRGDLLVCRLAEPAGRCCVLPDIGEERVVTSVDVTIFRPPQELADRRFLCQVFSTQDWFKTVSDRSGGTTHKRISRGALGRLSINLPKVPEQTAIAQILTDMDAELTALEQRREKTLALKQAMMQELLTGRTRLV